MPIKVNKSGIKRFSSGIKSSSSLGSNSRAAAIFYAKENRLAKLSEQPAFSMDDIWSDGSTGGGYFLADTSTIYQSGSSGDLADADGDTINSDGSIENLASTDETFHANGCAFDIDSDGYECIDIVDEDGHISFSGWDSPSDTRTLWASFTSTDNLFYAFSDKDANKGIGLLFQNNGGTTFINGVGGTISELNVSGKVYDHESITLGDLHQVMSTTGVITIMITVTGMSGSTGDFGIGNLLNGSSTSMGNGRIYGGGWVDRELAAAEKAGVFSTFGPKYGRALTGTPFPTTAAAFWGQSNTLASNTGKNAAIPVIPVTNRSLNYSVGPEEFVYPLADPVGSGTLGQSMVPQFALEWDELNNRPVLAIMGAVGGSYLLPEATAGWGKGASDNINRANFKIWVDEAIDLLFYHAEHEFYELIISGNQGEAEVLDDNTGTLDTITSPLYETAYGNLVDDFNTYFSGKYGSKYKGMFDFLNSPRYEDSSEFEMQYVQMVANNNRYNDVKMNVAESNDNLTMVGLGDPSYQSIYAAENVHIDARAQQEKAKILALGINGAITEPSIPGTPIVGYDLFMDDAQATVTDKTYNFMTASGADGVLIAVSGHLFATSSGQILFEAFYNDVEMVKVGSIETENTGEVGAAMFFISEEMLGTSLDAVASEIYVNCRVLNGTDKNIHAINAAVIYTQGVTRVDLVEGNIDLHSTDTASHPIKPVLNSVLFNLTAANNHTATAATATVTGLTELYDEAYLRTALSKNCQFVLSHGTLASRTSLTPSVQFSSSMDEIAPITVAMRGARTGESYVPILENSFVKNFHSDNTLPDGFTLTSGSENYGDGGLILDGSQYLDRVIDDSEDYLDLSRPGFAVMVYKPDAVDLAGDQFLFSISDGTATPQIAMRLYRNDGGGANTARMYVYPDSGASTTQYGEYENQAGVYDFAILCWESGNAAKIITDDGETIDDIGTITPANYNTIHIGDDHNGGSEFDGVIAKIEVGNSGKLLTMREAIAKTFIEGDEVLLAEGQSYNRQLFDSLETGDPVGHMAATLQASLILDEPNKLYVINGADSGSSLLSSSNADDAWLDNSGENLVADIRQIQSEVAVYKKGVTPTILWWAQYQGDVFRIAAGDTTVDDYKAGLLWKIARAQALYGTGIIIILEIPGKRNEAVTDSVDQAHQDLTECFIQVREESTANVVTMEGYDIEPYDTTGHPTNAGQEVRAKRAVRRGLAARGKDTTGLSTTGPSANVSAVTSSAATIDITHDQGTGLSSPASNYEGFKAFNEDGSEITISSTSNTTNQITLNFGSAPTGSYVDIKYPFGALEGVTLSNLVYDNSTEVMPLQSFYQRVTVT